jgi:outer membrane protein TolC
MNADRNVAQAKAGRRPDIDLLASYGRSRSADELDLAYQETESQEMLMVGFSVPIMNWGSNRSAYKAAVAQKEANQASYNMAVLQFQEEVVRSVRDFEMKYQELDIAERAEEIATRRFTVSQQRFSIGKIGMTDMNIAMQEKDNARRSYIRSLRSFWDSYYSIRLLTHYDFEKNEEITHPTPFPN